MPRVLYLHDQTGTNLEAVGPTCHVGNGFMHCEIHLTKEDLIAKDACSKGIELFDEMFPDGMHGIWDQTAQLLLIASPLRQYFGWACYWGLLPRYDLSYADLRYADLSSANLSYADLSYANLCSADLCSARNIELADLTGAYRFIDDAVIQGWTVVNGRLQRATVEAVKS